MKKKEKEKGMKESYVIPSLFFSVHQIFVLCS